MIIAAKQAKALAFSDKGAIHPKQITALNEVFTPSAAEVARARRIIETFEEAETGLVVDGKLIEKPVPRDVLHITPPPIAWVFEGAGRRESLGAFGPLMASTRRPASRPRRSVLDIKPGDAEDQFPPRFCIHRARDRSWRRRS